MDIGIGDNIVKYYLRNVYFISGHSFAGKSTMVKMLSERFDMIACGENYSDAFPRDRLSRWKQPGLAYFDTMSGWREWLGMTPEEHWRWTRETSRECTQIEILELVKLSASGKKIVADTNIPPEFLREISDYDHVAILLTDPPDIAARKFFDREDPDKKFMLEQIRLCPDPEAAMENFRSWLAYRPPLDTDWEHTGFWTYTRRDFERDTREEMLSALAEHFQLTQTNQTQEVL